MSRPLLYYPQFNNEDGVSAVSQFHGKDLIQIASARRTIPFYARAKLLSSFKSRLVALGYPEDVYAALEPENAVISGSFVSHFLEHGSSATPESGPHDIDVYVPTGRVDSFVHRIRSIPGLNFRSILVFKKEEDQLGGEHTGIDDEINTTITLTGPFYNNPGIRSMTRLSFVSAGDNFLQMDVIESNSLSPIMPILFFELSHVKAALSFDAYISFHPSWHSGTDKISYVNPRILSDSTEDDTNRPYTDAFLDKYRQRGFRIYGPTDAENTPGDDGHICYLSPTCPLTTRSTTDTEVQYVPLTEEAALASLSHPPPILSTPSLRWRHGGKCRLSNGIWESFEVTMEDDLNANGNPY